MVVYVIFSVCSFEFCFHSPRSFLRGVFVFRSVCRFCGPWRLLFGNHTGMILWGYGLAEKFSKMLSPRFTLFTKILLKSSETLCGIGSLLGNSSRLRVPSNVVWQFVLHIVGVLLYILPIK